MRGLAMMLALWFLVVPLVFAGPGGPGPDRVSAQRPVAQAAAQLPRCTIIGTQGNDTLVGTAGDDVICGLGGDDVIHGRGGDDVLFGSFGDDVLDGGPGNDELRGHWGQDRLLGGPGDDLLHGGGNADVLSGGSGSDTADYRTRVSPVRVSIGSGGANDGVTGENDDVRRDVENVLGGSKGDTLVGSGKANRLDGRGGNDVIEGGRGNDQLFGGSGVDRLDGRDAVRFRDRLNCGPGRGDEALADAPDSVAGNCEDVRQPQPGGVNRPPTAVTLSNDSVAENQPAGTLVGRLRGEDPDRGDELGFSLVAGSGDADNAAFRIDGADAADGGGVRLRGQGALLDPRARERRARRRARAGVRDRGHRRRRGRQPRPDGRVAVAGFRAENQPARDDRGDADRGRPGRRPAAQLRAGRGRGRRRQRRVHDQRRPAGEHADLRLREQVDATRSACARPTRHAGPVGREDVHDHGHRHERAAGRDAKTVPDDGRGHAETIDAVRRRSWRAT